MRKIFIIAEAGVNHNGNLDTALKMVDVAADAGVDAIKFQTFKTEKLVTRNAVKANYQLNENSPDNSQYDMLKQLELSDQDFRVLFNYTQKKGISFMSSPFDLESIDLLYELGLEIFKIPSGEITNLPYLKKIGSLNKKVFLSTGMSEMFEIDKAIRIIINSGTDKKNITLLHATTEYPAPFEEVNLNAIVTMAKEFSLETGYSDHTQGIEISIAAAALGASVIEKHFTLDRSMPGPDHKASLIPAELQEMVKAVRNIEKALGDGIKKPYSSELKNISAVRKSIHYSQSLPGGHIIKDQDLIMKRPGSGVSPMEVPLIINKVLLHNVEEDSLFKWDDIR